MKVTIAMECGRCGKVETMEVNDEAVATGTIRDTAWGTALRGDKFIDLCPRCSRLYEAVLKAQNSVVTEMMANQNAELNKVCDENKMERELFLSGVAVMA